MIRHEPIESREQISSKREKKYDFIDFMVLHPVSKTVSRHIKKKRRKKNYNKTHSMTILTKYLEISGHKIQNHNNGAHLLRSVFIVPTKSSKIRFKG